MSQTSEKTEQPTPKRLRDSRRKGQVAKSQDLLAALLLLTAVIVLAVAGGFTGAALTDAMHTGIERAATFEGQLDPATAISLLRTATVTMAMALAPLLGALLVVALLTGYLQVGGIFAAEALKPSLEKLNPVEGFKNKFLRLRPWVELGQTLLKITVCTVVIGVVLWQSRMQLIELARQPLSLVPAFTVVLLLDLGWKVAVAFLVLGAGDFFLQRFLHRKELMMTKQEVKEDYKETEGDPLHKHARRQRHREILMENLPAAVQKSNVVIVNPVHLAVALRYDRATMSAPVVTASGAELMAAHIRAIAQEAGIPVVRDAPLARALYELDMDEEIPEELYEAVALVLRWVYQLAAEQEEVASHV